MLAEARGVKSQYCLTEGCFLHLDVVVLTYLPGQLIAPQSTCRVLAYRSRSLFLLIKAKPSESVSSLGTAVVSV